MFPALQAHARDCCAGALMSIAQLTLGLAAPTIAVAQNGGVVISPAPDRESPVYVVSGRALARIGGAATDDAHALWDVTIAVLTPGGGVIAGRGRSGILSEFDAQGRFLRSIGVQGSGPGEFRSIVSARVGRADTLFVYDASARRISILDFRRVLSGMIAPADSRRGSLCCAADGSFLAQVMPAPAGAGIGYSEWAVVPGTQRVAATDPIERQNFIESRPRIRLATSRPQIQVTVRDASAEWAFAAIQVPFYVEPMTSFTSAAILNSTGERYEIEMFDWQGQKLRTVRVATPAVAVTRADARRVRDSIAERVTPASVRPAVAAALDTLDLPALHPAIDRILPDTGEIFWVRSADHTGRMDELWTRFTGDGRAAGSLTVPSGWSARAFAAGRVLLLRELPESGFQQLEVRTIGRAAQREVRR